MLTPNKLKWNLSMKRRLANELTEDCVWFGRPFRASFNEWVSLIGHLPTPVPFIAVAGSCYPIGGLKAI